MSTSVHPGRDVIAAVLGDGRGTPQRDILAASYFPAEVHEREADALAQCCGYHGDAEEYLSHGVTD
ncbi:unnamed protein product [Mycetohabitans rhizoxinica HKI 454]|uniref:Uncharacterized protein n=1 Tax=Mycetohabitans rhizoxinica (strain DSM 19002 / CIP 109453 / HKI 454) TaxID=882378 RepID=E5AKU5_MYCRK|nr:hypothetical protein [Mycetohabitans rhizoxinica]CBW75902.1 unnamed protein product [Mycetohabitans rhizoxinica HKI 454]